jgi:hypothetical protein
MTVDDLTHIFRFQTTQTEDYTPTDSVVYMLFERQNRVEGRHSAKDLASLIPLLDNFVFDGYRDKTPLFVKPEVIIPL